MTKSFENFLPHGGEASELFKKLTTKEDKYNSYLQTYYTRRYHMKEENNQIIFTGALSLDDLHKATRYQLIIRRKYSLTYTIVFLSLISFLLYKVFIDETTSQQSGYYTGLRLPLL